MKLLLVDDDAKLAGALRRGLTRRGFPVELAADGLDGLWRAREGGYDLIVLDIMLPGRNGYRVCADLRAVRRSARRSSMLTAKDGDLDEAEALDTGADDYLRKPFSFPVLVARVHALLRRAVARRSGAARPSATSSWTCGPAAAVRGGVTVALTAREFDLLTYLVRRAGQVVSKRRSSAGVWDDDFDRRPERRRGLRGAAAAEAGRAAGRVPDRDRPGCRLPHPAPVTRRAAAGRRLRVHGSPRSPRWRCSWCSPPPAIEPGRSPSARS